MKKDLLAVNADQAKKNRRLFDQNHITVVNLISSPGSGKTTLLEKTGKMLSEEFKLGAVVGDLYTVRDAQRIVGAGLAAVQINTEGLCHLNSNMVARALEELPLASLDLLFIENVGNLVCPVAFDLGEHVKVAVLSVTEGADKPAKYPGIFRQAAAVVISKVDLMPYIDFDLESCKGEIKEINRSLDVFVTSAKTGAGMEEWCVWLRGLVKA